MSQPQSQAPPRTFSPAGQMSPSPLGHAGFTNQPPSKKPRLSPAPSAQGLAQPGNATYANFARTNGLNNGAGSPNTPGTPNSITSPPLPSHSPAVASPFPMPSPVLPSASPSPIMAPAGMHPNSGARTNTNGGAGNGYGGGMPTPKLQPRLNTQHTQHTQHTQQQQHMPSPVMHTPTAGVQTPTQMMMTGAQTANNVFVPIASTGMPTPLGGPSVMGPPSTKPPTKEYQYDVDDSLAGTGIDLRQEEQFQADYFAGTYRPEARTGFPANAPGGRDSFYGALSANQPAELLGEADQKRAMVEEAKRQWTESAQNLARSRGNALHNRFLEFGALHLRADKIAKEYGLGILLDPKPSATAASGSFRMRPDTEFPKPQLTVSTKTGPDGTAMIATTGYFLPEDTYLADQLALLSLATKHRLRELLEDANKVAVARQTTSHGVVPEAWLDAATPLPAPTTGEAGRADHGTTSLKRSREASEAAPAPDAASTPEETAKKIAASNTLVQSLRVAGRTERSLEEQRLLKRQKREAKKAGDVAGTGGGASGTTEGAGGGTSGGGGGGTSGGGGAGDATTGDVAPTTAKPPTKKELKKSVAAKMAEQNETLSANQTSMAFLGGRKKQYSWLSGGSSTPRRSLGARGGAGGGGPAGGGAGGGGGDAGTPGGSGNAAGGASGAANRRNTGPGMLTGDGRTKWGAWREDGIKGKDIQLRDLVVVLEADGREVVALQSAYTKLDGMASERPRGGV